jgi:hypothetical protein
MFDRKRRRMSGIYHAVARHQIPSDRVFYMA